MTHAQTFSQRVSGSSCPAKANKNRRRSRLLILATLTTLLCSQNVFGQEITLDYFPLKGDNVQESEYRKGKYILENTYQSIRDHGGELVYADYWNVATAYSRMGVDTDTIMVMFQESKRTDAESFGEIVARMLNGKDPNENRLINLLGQPFRDLITDCDLELVPTTLEQRMNEMRTLDLEGLNTELIRQLLVLLDKDQRFRYSSTSYAENIEEQRELDAEVQTAIAAIFDEHGYPGLSLVGEKYSGLACLLLEHGGELAHQEKYFPLVAGAFRNGEAPRCCILMLVDRIHWKKTTKQIFGSHIGVPLDSDEVIAQTKEDLGW